MACTPYHCLATAMDSIVQIVDVFRRVTYSVKIALKLHYVKTVLSRDKTKTCTKPSLFKVFKQLLCLNMK